MYKMCVCSWYNERLEEKMYNKQLEKDNILAKYWTYPNA